MTGAEIKAENWREMRDALTGIRLRIYEHLLNHAATLTTRQIAADMDEDILFVRPRVTELVHLGLVRCAGRENREGIYEAVPVGEALGLMKVEVERQRGLQLEDSRP